MIIMNEKRLRLISRTGLAVVVLVGCIFGIYLTIIGYLTDSGPGGSMEGPIWRIALNGMLSALIGSITGAVLFRILEKNLSGKKISLLEITIKSFTLVLIASFAAFVASWVVGYFVGKITGTIEGLDWIVVLIYTPLMSFVYGIPVSLITAVLFGIFVFFYLKTGQGKETSSMCH
jgi:hypothetical protein